MFKVTTPDSWDFGVVPTVLVPYSSRGLVGSDFQLFEKRAGDFAGLARKVAFYPGEIPVHSIALGIYERYGANRNADGFRKRACERYHKTFEKLARYFYWHKNKDPSQSRGIVKLAYFNEPMGRIELLLALNQTKEAAERNGGLIADASDFETLARGNAIDLSMSCKVAWDVCSSCGNKARNRSEYCDADTCPHGGCKHNLGKVAEDGHRLHVDNPDPHWFDISKVRRGADFIAYGHAADYLQKAAAAEITGVSGAELAELWQLQAPASVLLAGLDNPLLALRPFLADRVKLACELADQKPAKRTVGRPLAKLAALPPRERGVRTEEILTALADVGGLLPVRDFVELSGGDAKVAAEAAAILPGVLQRMTTADELVSRLAAAPKLDDRPSRALQKWAREISDDVSVSPSAVRVRCWHEATRGPAKLTTSEVSVKISSVATGEAEEAARRYAAYAVTAFARMRRTCPEVTTGEFLAQTF